MYKYVLRNSLYLDDELQDYFNEMSKKGWRLDFVGYYYRFVKDEHVYKYQIDYTPVSSEYNEVLKEMEQTNKEIEQAEGEFLSLLKELTSSDEKIMASLNELVKKMER